MQVLQSDTKLCKHSGTKHAFGLPHVIRLVSKAGAFCVAVPYHSA